MQDEPAIPMARTMAGVQADARPRVSVIMANYRGAAYLAASMRAVLAQTEARLELILADDGSDDDSLEIARDIARSDDRVRVLDSTRNLGPAGTRNRAVEAAQGDWLAIVDSDDLIHPERLARLLAAAETTGADMVADDLVHFGNGEARTLLQPLAPRQPEWLTAAELLRSNADPRLPAYGYLKPLIRHRTLGPRRYDTTLRIGEDHDLMLRLVVEGARFLLLPDPLYAYRRHGGSISHRLSVETVAAMLAAHEALPAMPDPEAGRAALVVGRQLRKALRYERLVAAIKGRRWGEALPAMADPAMLARLAGSLADRRRRRATERNPASGLTAVAPVVPPLPEAGGDWAEAPAHAAAWIVAAVQAKGQDHPAPSSAPSRDLPANLPPWADWLAHAIRE